MSQNIIVNPVALASNLAAYRIDELYLADNIPYPYIEDKDEEFSTYTEQGQETFDKWYDWYYHIVTLHNLD
jgi:hypothetical protein